MYKNYMIKSINHVAANVPFKLNGSGIWYIMQDSMIPGELIVTNGMGPKRVKKEDLSPYEGFFFSTPEFTVNLINTTTPS